MLFEHASFIQALEADPYAMSNKLAKKLGR